MKKTCGDNLVDWIYERVKAGEKVDAILDAMIMISAGLAAQIGGKPAVEKLAADFIEWGEAAGKNRPDVN